MIKVTGELYLMLTTRLLNTEHRLLSVQKLFGDLKAMGYNTCIISNNKEYRVKPLADEVGSLYVSKAGKPSPKIMLKLWSI